jgi:hypothetical protein
MIQRTHNGLFITAGTLKLVVLATTVIVGMMTGIIAAVRFFDRASNAPTRAEFLQHVRADDSVHAVLHQHNLVLDSAIAEGNRNNHGLVCFVYRNPLPFCRDVQYDPVRKP